MIVKQVTPDSARMAAMGEEARVHTFLFADLAGFTALTEAHGDEEAAELAALFSDCVHSLLPEHGAEAVKTIGDAVMVRCDEASAAVELGLRITEGVGSRPQFPIVRVGMHTGPAIERGGDWFGSAVNLAARVSGAAGGDEVLLSEATKGAAGELHGIELERRGERRFKNVREAVALYQARREGSERGVRAIDPVCRMAVAPAEAAGTLTYQGHQYYFCSLECARKFAAEPERFAESPARQDARGERESGQRPHVR
jgi:adenylate cyclase